MRIAIWTTRIAGVAAGVVSGVLWFWAGTLKAPTSFILPSSLGGIVSPELNKFAQQMALQSRLNSYAALAMMAAVILLEVFSPILEWYQQSRHPRGCPGVP